MRSGSGKGGTVVVVAVVAVQVLPRVLMLLEAADIASRFRVVGEFDGIELPEIVCRCSMIAWLFM